MSRMRPRIFPQPRVASTSLPCPSTSTVAEPLPDAVPPPQAPTPIVTESSRPSAPASDLSPQHLQPTATGPSPCPPTPTVADPLPDAVPPPQSPTPIVTESPRPSASTFELPSPQAPPNDFELPPQLPTSTAAEPSVQPPPQPVTEPLRPSQVFNVASPSTPDLVLGPPSDSDLFDAETDLGEMETCLLYTSDAADE